MNVDTELIIALKKFIESFEEVFDKDWEYSKEMLGIQDSALDQIQETTKLMENLGFGTPEFNPEQGTFINPNVEDEIEDWGNRGALLQRYRRLKQLLASSHP